jgi:hypothetical protein
MGEPLDTFIRLRARLQKVREESGWILGEIDVTADDESLLADLDTLREEGALAEIYQNNALVFPNNLSVGVASIKVDSGRLPGFFETYDSLVSKHPVDPPERFTVWHEEADIAKGCRAAWALLHFLREKVEVWDETQMRFFLVDQHAIEVPLHYPAASTRGLPSLVPQVQRFLAREHLDADARWAFFRKSSSRLLRDEPVDARLGRLFVNLGQVLKRTEQDHSLYLERFSFEDLLKTFDETRLKFVSDLNQVLAGLQTATVAVPVAFFLVAEKFKPSNGFVGQNVVLGVGGIVFCVLLFVFSLNQGLTLEAIRKAVSDFEVEQLRKQSERSGRLKTLLEGTWSHYRKVRRLLWTVRVLLVCFALVIAGTLAWCSLPILQKQWPYQSPAANSISAPEPIPTASP